MGRRLNDTMGLALFCATRPLRLLVKRAANVGARLLTSITYEAKLKNYHTKARTVEDRLFRERVAKGPALVTRWPDSLIPSNAVKPLRKYLGGSDRSMHDRHSIGGRPQNSSTLLFSSNIFRLGRSLRIPSISVCKFTRNVSELLCAQYPPVLSARIESCDIARCLHY